MTTNRVNCGHPKKPIAAKHVKETKTKEGSLEVKEALESDKKKQSKIVIKETFHNQIITKPLYRKCNI